MSQFAGIVSIDGSTHVPQSVRDDIDKSMNKSGRKLDTYSSKGCHICKVDINAYQENGSIIDENNNSTFVTGHPYLQDTDNSCRGAVALHQAFLRKDDTIFKKARGVFSSSSYTPHKNRLLLSTDKLGIRPVYYSRNDKYFVFSSRLGLFDHLPFINRSIDTRGILELVTFGFPLAKRTPFVEVEILRDGEYLIVENGKLSINQYWDWSEIEETSDDPSTSTDTAYQLFDEAITIRANNDSKVVATVSGGMDSRSILAVLRKNNLDVVAFNFSKEGSQDQYCARAFSQAADIQFVSWPRQAGEQFGWLDRLREMLEKESVYIHDAERPGLLWSGDGGSVGVGTVYLNREIVETANSKPVQEALYAYLRANNIGTKKGILTDTIKHTSDQIITDAITSELQRFGRRTAAEALHLFLMANDQRRHLNPLFEDIDVYGFEYHLPFFDSNFLSYILSVPIEYRLNHRFYTDWWARFPKFTSSVPWQNYPGHQPSLVPLPDELQYQWEKERVGVAHSVKQNIQLAQTSYNLITSEKFPNQFVDRKKLAIRSLLSIFGIRDAQYLIEAAEKWVHYAEKTSGPPKQ